MGTYIVGNDELYHHGILGMKWGVRKKSKLSSDERADRSNNRRRNELSNLSKNRKLLSDKTLKDKIARLKLEKEFKDIVQDDLKPGKKAINEILLKIGKNTAVDLGTKFATGTITYMTKNALTKDKFDGKELASFLIKDYKKKEDK